MAAKVKCRSCGAKNDPDTRRCRVCATIINMNAPDPSTVREEPPPNPVMQDNSFDSAALDRDRRPTKAKLGSGGGALAARLAAAGNAPTGPAPAPAPADPGPHAAPPPAESFASGSFSGDSSTSDNFSGDNFSSDSFAGAPPMGGGDAASFGDPGDAIVIDVAPKYADTPPPLEYESEKFDPNDLFRD